MSPYWINLNVLTTRTPLIPALWRQRQVEFKVSLVYRVSSRKARATEKPCLQKNRLLKTFGGIPEEYVGEGRVGMI